MKKSKDPKAFKRAAFLSFLESPTTPASEISGPALSPSPSQKQTAKTTEDMEDYDQQYVEGTFSCTVCGIDIDPTKRKKCGFCNLGACTDHMRKRRPRRGKFQKICDNCDDRVLYEIYMKLQAKAEESLSVEEEITILKHENFFRQAQERRQKRRQIAFKTMSLKQKHDQQSGRLAEEEKRLALQQQSIQSLQLSVEQLQEYIHRIEASFKQNSEQDYNILSQENARLAKQLAKLQKKGMEIKVAFDKREKEIESAFELWSQKQFKKKLEQEERAVLEKKSEGCELY